MVLLFSKVESGLRQGPFPDPSAGGSRKRLASVSERPKKGPERVRAKRWTTSPDPAYQRKKGP